MMKNNCKNLQECIAQVPANIAFVTNITVLSTRILLENVVEKCCIET